MANPIDRRVFLSQGLRVGAGAAVVGGASSLLAACGSGGTTSGSASASGSSSGISAGPPRRGGSLVVGVESEVNGFNPRSGRFDPGGVLYARTVFDPLTAYAADGSVQPYLAESLSHNNDYTKWTINLRPGIKFHDGIDVDANAVKINLDGLVASPLTGPALSNVAGTEVVSPLSVVVSMKEPWPPFPIWLTGQLGFVVAPSMLSNPAGNSQPVGTGPFVFKEWVPNDHFTATRNPAYWRTGLPYLDQITFKPIPDLLSRDQSLAAGTLDLIHSSDTDTLVQFRSNPGFAVVTDANSTVGEPDMTFVMLNTARSPLTDTRLRKALALATNPQSVIATVENGIPQPATGPYPTDSPYYSTTGYPTYDLSQAKSLVSSIQQGGPPISLELGTTNSPKNLQTVQLLAEMWQQAGIQTRLAQVEQTQFILNALQGNYEAYLWRQFAAPDPDINYVWWSIPDAAAIGSSALNFARNKDQQIQAALDTGRTHTEAATRTQAYQTIGKRFGVDVPYLWMYRTIWVIAARKGVENFNGGTLPSGAQLLGTTGGTIWLTQTWLNP